MFFNKSFVALLLATGLSVQIFAQVFQEKNLERSYNDPYASPTYIGQQTVKLKPGYHYQAQGTNKMHAYIDKSIIVPADYQALYNSTTFDGRQIDQNLAVGYIPASYDVSPTGAATYTIPIQVPMGTNGMQPSLSVNYNSQGGSGLLGVGWDLAGLSVITRVGKTIYHDGKVEPIKFDATDNFALDGNRLIGTSGTYGANGATYATEAETFSRVTSFGQTGNGPQWFQVENKSGMILEYGKANNSQFLEEATVGNSVIVWRINKMTDQYGNYCEYFYDNTDRESRITKILYTKNDNAGLNHYNEVNFYYDRKTDVTEAYLSSSKVNGSLLLRQIEVLNEGQIIKKYDFTYGYSLYSYLNEVIESGNSSDKYNSTIFKYLEQTPTTTSLNTIDRTGLPLTSTGGKDILYYSGDFNGDGLTDLLGINYVFNPSNSSEAVFTLASVFIKNKGSGFTQYTMPQSFITQINRGGNFSQFNKGNSFPIGEIKILITDLDGDSHSDIIVGNLGYSTTSGNDKDYFYYRGYLSTIDISSGATVFIQQPTVVKMDNFSGGTPIVNNFHAATTGDFDGDGRFEFFGINARTSDYFIVSFDGRLNIWRQINNNITNIVSPTVSATDYDGDGTTEIEYRYTQSVANVRQYIDVNLSGATVTDVWTQSISYNNLNVLTGEKDFAYDFYVDFNGDGLQDLLGINGGSVNHLWISKGYSPNSNYSDNSYLKITNADPALFSNNVYYRDVNGDGRTDVVKLFATNLIIYENLGGSSGQFNPIVKNHSLGWDSKTVFDFADFDGDGALELIAKNTEYCCLDILSLYPKTSPKSRLLEAVKNGFNSKTKFNYDFLTTSPTYQKENGNIYPLAHMQAAFPIVASVEGNDGIGGQAITSYVYEKAKVHKQGKGFLGFDKVIAINQTTGYTIETEFNEPTLIEFYARQIKKQTIKLTSNQSLVSETNNTNSFNSLGNKRYWARTDASTTTDHINTMSVTTTSVYDVNGNLTQQTTNNGVETSTIVNSNYTSQGSWLPTSPQTIVATNTRQGKPAYSRTTNFTYNNQGSVVTEIQDPSLSKQVTTTFAYNQLGNNTLVKVSAAGLQDRQTTSVFDSKGRLPEQTTNSLNQTEYRTYDYRWGKPLSVTGIDGLITSFTYDGLGKLKTETDPKGVTTAYNYLWDIGQGGSATGTTNNNHIYYVEVSNPGNPDVKTWFDVHDREIITQTDGFSQPIFTVTSYDQRGNVATSTTPFYQNSPIPAVVTTNTYDVYSRLIQTQNSAGTSTRSYSASAGQLTVTSTDMDGKTSKTITDASGKVISSEDPDGSILTYEYHSNGNQDKIKLNGVEITSMEYDDYARQIKLTEKNSGITIYEYDAFGQLVDQKDANGNNYVMIYDVMGRLIQKTGTPDGPYNYLYQSSGNGINLLVRSSSGNGYLKEYTYDAYNRVTEAKETIGTEVFTTNYTYDNFDNLTSITYPSGFVLNKTYDANSYLTTVKDGNNTTIFTANAKNAFNQYTSYTLGNGKTTINQIDKYGFLGKSEAVGIYSMRYNWNVKNANLNYREDLINGWKEDFTYDNLYRLTKVEYTLPLNPKQTLQDLTYANNGNILTKTDAGNYNYDPNKINALTEIQNANVGNGGISMDQQDITYTPFLKAATITEGSSSNMLTFSYGADFDRKKVVLTNNTHTFYTRYFLPGYEKNIDGQTGDVTEVHYINCGDGLNAMYVAINGVGTMYYTYTDHLGSIVRVTDNQAQLVAEQSFDAWGRRRNPTFLTYFGVGPLAVPVVPNWLWRGYTGHEHLRHDAINLDFGLINMNGRMYDPINGRMLSPDNFVQSPYNTQNYNRYSYVMNNPLKYTDPTGELPHLVVAAIVGVVTGGINVAANWSSIDGFWEGAASFGLGFGSGFAAVATGGASLGVQLAVATGTSAVVAGGNDIISQTNNFQGRVDWGQVGYNSAIGGFTGAASFGASRYVGNSVLKGDVLLGTSLRISGRSIPGAAIKNGLGGFAGGYTSGFLLGLSASGGDFSEANRIGLRSGGLGTVTGIGFGAGSAYFSAKHYGYDPWSGNYKQPITPYDLKNITDKTSIMKNGREYEVKPRVDANSGDGSSSYHIFEIIDGNKVSVTHMVVSPNGYILHQHQFYIGNSGARYIPNSNSEFPMINIDIKR